MPVLRWKELIPRIGVDGFVVLLALLHPEPQPAPHVPAPVPAETVQRQYLTCPGLKTQDKMARIGGLEGLTNPCNPKPGILTELGRPYTGGVLSKN